MGHVTRHMFKRSKQKISFASDLLYSTVMLLYYFYYILLKTVPYRSDPFQMDIAYWIRTERFTEPNRTEPLQKTGVDNRLKTAFIEGTYNSENM